MLEKRKSAVATLGGDSQAGRLEPTQPGDRRLGTVIDGRYRVESLIGRGGMGLVYRATHIRLHKTFAIKVLRRGSDRDSTDVARFQREAESASAIGNAHIVSVSDFGTLPDGSTYFAMEYLEGIDLLGAMMAVGAMPVDRACHIAIQLCRALSAAHEIGIVHRDLKPENVFLVDLNGNPDFVKVLDFGIAKVAHAPSSLTQDDILGTPQYMSPEQCDGLGIDHRTDVYALGVLLYEMLSGHVPHDDQTATAIFHKHLHERPTPIEVHVPNLPPRLRRIIERCLEKKPERRYQSMDELRADLDRFRRTREGQPAPARSPAAHARRKRSMVRIGFLTAALVSLFVVAVSAAFSHARTEPDSFREDRRLPPDRIARPAEGDAAPQEVQALDPPASLSRSVDAPTADPPARRLRKRSRKSAPRPSAQPRRRSKASGGPDEVLDPWM